MRLPRLPAPVARGLDVVIWALLSAAVVTSLWRFGGWLAMVTLLPAMAAVHLFWPLPVPDDEGCLKCRHAHVHHQGTCQACLRDVVAGVPLSAAVPCDRFQRWSPRTRWEQLRGARVPGLGPHSEQEAPR